MSDVVRNFLEELSEINLFQAKFSRISLENLSDDEFTALSRYIVFYDSLFGNGASSRSYDFFCKEIVREELLFKRNKSKRYTLNSEEEARRKVYFNEEYMKKYMIGLSLSTFIWPNHLAMSRYFMNNVPRDRRGGYLEVGVGHGRVFAEVMSSCRFDEYIGCDISRISIDLTARTAEFIAPGASNYDLLEGDFMSLTLERDFDAIVCGEVIEHVERPRELLNKIRFLARDDAFIYVTTAVNSPALDHIHLFRATDEIVRLFGECGLEVLDFLELPPSGKSLEEAVRENQSINVAFVLKRRA